MIPSSFIQDLLSRTDVVDVVSRHVALKKSGANHMGLCPFHGEKTASFSVSPSRQIYHCFGCGTHGNAIGFLMEYMGLGFVEAVTDLAQQMGMVVPQDTRSSQERALAQQTKTLQATLSSVLQKASESYQHQLTQAPQAQQYLRQRGLSEEVIALFNLGYAPGGWRHLAGAFARYDDPLLEDSGLVISSEAGEGHEKKRYDRFRDRIMFPIKSVQGEVIGFGGRVLGQDEPKYLNSPETALFVKGRELYGLHEARVGLRKRGYALVVEGYMDVVALAQSGLTNAVATLGTACTSEHLHKLFRFTDAIVFSFDGDSAGQRAADRALQASLPLVSDTRHIKFLFLPPEHDPDSYVRAHGLAAFEALIQKATPLSQQLLALAKRGCEVQTTEGRAKLLAQAKPLWTALPPGVFKIQLLTDIATAGGISATDLSELWGQSSSSLSAPATGSRSGFFRPRSTPTPTRLLRSPPLSPADSATRLLLLHSRWWEESLTAADHELLCALPEPHGVLFKWLERYIHEHGAPSWAVCEQALQDTPWADWVAKRIPPSVLEDEMHSHDLQHVLNHLWIKHLQKQQDALIAQAHHNPDALVKWRELDTQRKKRMPTENA